MKREPFPAAKRYRLAHEAVEVAAKYVVGRLWKHLPAPRGWTAEDEIRLRCLIEDNVLLELCERFDFSDD